MRFLKRNGGFLTSCGTTTFSPCSLVPGVHGGYVIMKGYFEDNNEISGSIMENL
jgi:hypothetical protein